MTALMDMAAARPPGIADARVPCPLCGGLIHPVAGRCKHCKEDLSSFRAGRPQAAAALPALNGKPAATTNGTNGHAVAAAAPAAAVPTILPAREGSQPILPPRTTARSVQAQRPPSMWRSWPMLVIGLAVVAIVAATVIMVMPQGSAKPSHKVSAPPAPERMETNPLPEKSSSLDPWGAPGGAPQQAVPPMAPVTPRGQPQPPDPDDDFAQSGGIGISGGSSFTMNGTSAFMVNVLDHACTKFKACPDVDQSMISSICDAVGVMPKAAPPAGCQAAKRCFDAIDRMSCAQAQSSSPQSVLTLFQDCTEAATQC